MTYRFTIPGRLPGLNEYITACRTSPYKGAKLKADAERAVTAAAQTQLRGLRITRPVTMDYAWIEKDRRRDLDNVSSFGRKIIQDSLVQCGILRNDGWKEITGFSDAFAVDKKHPRIEVTILEI